ncbi:MAG: DUF362 domain-containing protein [Candidatus Latescibacteria bacterium]|nr:DUF362 domain-containing protein [Candidatus Latescibacterota bacterium]
MITRRRFIKNAASIGGLGLVKPVHVFGARAQTSSGKFGVHPFIEKHPEAVFIMHTNVDIKTNSPAKKDTGFRFVRSVFFPMENGGLPLTHMIPVKPNLTASQTDNKDFSLEFGMGIVTDPYFVEGVIEGMKELGLSGSQFYLREVNAPEDFGPRGYTSMAERTGADIRDLNEDVRTIGKEFIQWADVPDAVVHEKIPYLWPVNAPNTFYLNIAKFKTHDTGLTLCCKNHQGTVANKYQRFCHGVTAFENYHYDYLTRNTIGRCADSYDRHLAGNVPLWDRLTEPGKDKNLSLDAWCQRTCDNLSSTTMGLCIVEGIYGRDDAFLTGPNPPLHNDKGKREAWDYMTNIIIFGKDPVLVDVIGHWLGGHEPGQFGFFHIALERGLTSVIDPRKIPVYTWDDGAAKLTPLPQIQRTPMLSSYIPKDRYDTSEGAHASLFYMYDDPFDYNAVNETITDIPLSPGAQVLDCIRTNAANPFVAIEYTLPADGFVRLDISDSDGNRLETIANGYYHKGAHCMTWNVADHSGGTYYYTFSYRDFSETKKLILT